MSVSKAKLSELRCASCRCSSPGKSRSRRLEGQRQHIGIGDWAGASAPPQALLAIHKQRRLSFYGPR